MKGRSNKAAVANTPQEPIDPADDSGPVVVRLADTPDALPMQTPRLLSRQQAAAYCSVSPETFDDYRRRGMVLITSQPLEKLVTSRDINGWSDTWV